MVLIKMIGWGMVAVLYVIYAIKQALIRDFIGTIIAAVIMGIGVWQFRRNRKLWKAMRDEKKAAREKTKKGGDNITPFPTAQAAPAEEESPSREEPEAADLPQASEEPAVSETPSEEAGEESGEA